MGNSLLLALGSLVDRIFPGVLRGRVVLVLVDILGKLVLLLGERSFVGGSQTTIVLLAHVVLFVVEFGFFLLQIGRFCGGELAGHHTVGDAVLLVVLTLLNGLSGNLPVGRCVGTLRHNWQGKDCERCTQKYELALVLHKNSSSCELV